MELPRTSIGPRTSQRAIWCVALAAMVAATRAAAQSVDPVDSAWRDPSPHVVHIVTVAPGVRLEVLAWAGPAGAAGAPLVFLPGLGNTAHAYDVFASRFRDGHAVYAVTPRGFGASSRPAGGYDAATRARDVLAVLDSLGLARVVLVGHSFAGEVITRVAGDRPERVRALVYLDAYSYGRGSDLRWSEDGPPAPPQASPAPPITAADSASPAAMTAYLSRASKVAAIEAEVRAVARFGPTGHLEAFLAPNAFEAVYASAERSDYRRVRAPALALYGTTTGVREMFPKYAHFDAANRRMADRYYAFDRRFQTAQIARFRAETRCGVARALPGAGHFLHYSRAGEVERLTRAFLAGRLAAPGPACRVARG